MAKKNRDLNRSERAAQLRAEQAKAERNRRLFIGGGLLVAIALIATVLIYIQTSGKNDSVKVKGDIPASVGTNSLKIGPDSAKHKIVVWEDFLCPFCREFEQGGREVLHAAAKKGTVQVEYRPFQLLQDDYSKEALAAFVHVLEEGTPSQALALHDLMYDNQPYESGRKPDANQIADWVKEVGLSKNAARSAIDDGATDWSAAASKAAEEAGVKGTPTVTVDGKPLQGKSISEMIESLKKAIA